MMNGLCSCYVNVMLHSWVLEKKRGLCVSGRVGTPIHPMCSFDGRHVSIRETGNTMLYVFLTE